MLKYAYIKICRRTTGEAIYIFLIGFSGERGTRIVKRMHDIHIPIQNSFKKL
jgi:hypothetical protein